MSADEAVAPVSFRIFVVVVWSFGIAANAFLLALLWRYVPKWRLGKTLLFAVHAVALQYLLIAVFPAAIALATRRGLSSAQCALVAPLFQVQLLLQPLILCLSAVLRLRVVRSTLRMDGKSEPRASRYVVALVGVVVIFVVACAVLAARIDAPARWSSMSMVCLRPTPLFDAALILAFIAPIPIMLYCYGKIFKAFRTAMGDRAPNQNVKDMVRLFIVLSAVYYISYLPITALIVLEIRKVEVPLMLEALSGLIQTSYSAISPILSIVLTPRYLRIARALLARQSVSAVVTKKSIGSATRMSGVKTPSKGRASKASATKTIEVVPAAAS